MDGDITGADLASAMTGGGASAPAATPTGTSTPSGTPAAATGPATTPPAGVTTTPGSPKPPGPMPFDAHKTALENARTKAVDEYRAKYGWAEQIPEQEFRQALAIAQRVSADPVAHLQELIAELQAHPQHGATLRSLAAKALAAGRGRTTPTMPQPDVEIIDASGQVVGRTYSEKAQQQRDAVLLSQVREEFAPLVQSHKTREEEHQRLADEAAGKQFAATFMGELKTYPHFETHKGDIGQEVVRMLAQYPKTDPRLNQPAFLEALTLRAYHRIVTPTLDQSSRQAVLHDIHAKTQTGVSPGAQPIAAPSTYKDLSWEDALRQEAQRVGIA